MQNVSRELLLSCRGCGQEVQLRRLSYSKGKKRLLCDACITGRSSDLAKTASTRDVRLEKTGPRARTEENFVRYTCGECSFKFSRARHFTFLQCPYCSSPKLIIDAVAEQIMERRRLIDDLYG